MKKSLIALVAVLSMLIILVFALVVFGKTDDEGSTVSSQNNGKTEKWQEGIISYNDKYYRYNSQIKSYLFMGIDKDGYVKEVDGGGDGGQSDVLFLLIQDKKNETVSMIAINRNTLTEVDTYDINNKYVSTDLMQICLQHSFGDGARLSCGYTVNAVSKLLNDIPISGYYSLNMDGIPILNDAVGGIKLEILEDVVDKSRKVSLKKGETKTLTGKEAYVYIRKRDVNKFNSATDRLERQKQYIEILIDKLRKTMNRSLSEAASIYEQLNEYAVTDIQLADLMLELKGYEYNGKMYTLPGEMTEGSNYEEYVVDDEELYQLVLDIFYEEVEE